MLIKTNSTDETRKVGADLAKKAKAGDVFALIGDLGAGKTEFVRGFADALSDGAPVRSPTFTIVNTYLSENLNIHHFDFYRLGDESELLDIGFDEYIADNAVCLIEWADMFLDSLPDNTIKIYFSEDGETSRTIKIIS